MLTELSTKVRTLMGQGLRRVLRVTGILRRDDVPGFEITLTPSRDDARRYAIEAIRPIDRCTARRTLRTCGLAAGLVPVLPGSPSIGEERDELGETDAAARIRFVGLTPEQALSMFETIRRRDPDVRKLYASLEEKCLEPIEKGVRGAVIRAYSEDGVAREEGVVIELPHKGTDGTEAVFNVSIREGMFGEGEVEPGAVKADYEITRGGRGHKITGATGHN